MLAWRNSERLDKAGVVLLVGVVSLLTLETYPIIRDNMFKSAKLHFLK